MKQDKEKLALLLLTGFAPPALLLTWRVDACAIGFWGSRPKITISRPMLAPKASPACSITRVAVGAKFGVMLVVLEGEQFEVATFRAEPVMRTAGVRRRFGSALCEEDVKRRDFTIGGMYLDPDTGRIIDLVGGMRDLRARRHTRDRRPELRFAEDHLRMLRAVRFAARLNFTIDPATWCGNPAQRSENCPDTRGANRRRSHDDHDSRWSRAGIGSAGR